MLSRTTAVCCLVLSCSLLAQARFVVEQSALKIKFPTSGRQAHPDGFDMSLANFGAPQYGGSLVYALLASLTYFASSDPVVNEPDVGSRIAGGSWCMLTKITDLTLVVNQRADLLARAFR